MILFNFYERGFFRESSFSVFTDAFIILNPCLIIVTFSPHCRIFLHGTFSQTLPCLSSTRNTTVFKGHSDVRKSVSEITIGLEFKDEDEDANISFAVYANVNEDENQWEKLTIEGCEMKDGEIVLDLECSKSYRDYKVYVYTDDNCELGECEMTYTFHLRSYSDGINPNMLARYSKYMD